MKKSNRKRNLTLVLVLIGVVFCFANAMAAPDYYEDHDHHESAFSSTPASSASKATRLVFDSVVMTPVKSIAEKKKADAQKAMHMSRTLGGVLRYEDAEIGNQDGDVFGLNLGMAVDYEKFSYGFIIPYDHLDFDNLFDADRFGAVVFGQYHQPLNANLSATLTGNVNYIYSDIDLDMGGGDSVDTFGGGLSAGVTLDKETFATTVAVSYQYNEDDVDIDDDHQHLFKLGSNVGFRIGEQHVITCYAIYNNDFTDYDVDLKDDDYFELGTEFGFFPTDTWGLTVGFKKVCDLDDYESNEYYLGSALKF